MAQEDVTSLDNAEKWDQSVRAEAVLEHILSNDTSETLEIKEDNRPTVAEAIHARPVIDQDTGRAKARVLFVTTDESVLVQGSVKRQEYIDLAKQFDEVHVFCMIARSGQDTLDRADTNIWFYQIRSKNWWQSPWTAKAAANQTLVWNNTIRPDIVVGVDPFEAGIGAYFIAKAFQRPFQLHLYTNPFTDEYLKANVDNNWRLRAAKYLLRRTNSIRTVTAGLQEVIKKKYPKILDSATIPRFYNFTGLLSAESTFDLHQRYPSFAFIILAFGPLTADSYLHDLFSALNRLLHNPRIGMVVIGDGPAKSLFEEKVKLLGLEKNVVFQKEIDDLASYLKTADLLIEMSTAEKGEVHILQAAAAGLPAVMWTTDLRRDLFKDGESAFLCEPDDLVCIYQKTSKFINSASLQLKFSTNAQDVARERLHEDPEAHYQAIALSIESILIEGKS